MSPTERTKDTPQARHRSFKGCWTCKKKRIQCDEVRPSCQRCSLRGITCEGYEIRLRWGAGIASRGKYSGAEKPVKESIPPRSKRRWDMRGKAEEKEEGDRQGQPALSDQTSVKGNFYSHPSPGDPILTYNIRTTGRSSCPASNGQYSQLTMGSDFS
jgi:hypothetical protein